MAFHGFGQEAESYNNIAESLADSHTVYSFDLFFHGESKWPHGDKPISKLQLGSLIASFLTEHQIDRFTLAGFSLGAKFATSIYELFPKKVDGMILIAPESIKTNFWYKLATGSVLMRILFKALAKNPGLIVKLAKWMTNMRLIDSKLSGFALKQLESEENRLRVYHSWVVFRKLKTKISDLVALMNRHRTKATIYLGDLDKVITFNSVKKLTKKIPELVDIKTLSSDHNRLLEAVARAIKEEGL